MINLYLAIPAFIIGVVFLYKSSDMLVEGTSKVALHFGISTLIISAIFVGFGTSAPELAISVGAAVQNQPGISIGNIIGSCIANLLLVLGFSAIIRPISINKNVFKREMLFMLGATLLLIISARFGLLDTYHIVGGIIFLLFFVLFIWYFIKCGKKERKTTKQQTNNHIQKNILRIILGIAGVIVGAFFLIESSIFIAEFLGISKLIIALSLVAIGTSLPELVVSAMAAFKKESDIAVGNVLGSNIFNILLILGLSALFIPLQAMNSFDYLLILLGVSLIMFPILYTGYVISKREGIFMLILYFLFIWYIFF
ncbi:MAG: calcium/sodium antiporter [Thermoplasmatota archaeon]